MISLSVRPDQGTPTPPYIVRWSWWPGYTKRSSQLLSKIYMDYNRILFEESRIGSTIYVSMIPGMYIPHSV
jgi:hypothetical protein